MKVPTPLNIPITKNSHLWASHPNLQTQNQQNSQSSKLTQIFLKERRNSI